MTDYISREAFLEHIRKGPLFDLVEHYGLSNVIEWFPAADVVEVVHGEWLHRVNQMNDDDWACSNCGMYFCFEVGNPIANGTYYCPNCGAKMDGGKDNE